MQLILIGSKKTTYYLKLQKKNLFLRQKYGNRNIQMLIDVPPQKTIEYVKQASIYLMSSLKEAFPISLVEAMAAGTPFVSTDVGVAKYLSGGVVCNTPEEMAYWIDLFFCKPYIRRSLARMGRYRYKKDLMVPAKVELLHRLIIQKISSRHKAKS